MTTMTLEELAVGAEKIYANARALYGEARLLTLFRSRARALCLHQISLEECAKLDMLGPWAVSIIAGHDVDEQKLRRSFSNHGNKNRTNAYLLESSEAELEARQTRNWSDAIEAFKSRQQEFHLDSNRAKNASLYVDMRDGQFLAPSEQITAEMLSVFGARNRAFLAGAKFKVRLAQNCANAPDSIRNLVVDFIAKAEAMRESNPDDREGAINDLISNFLASGRKEHA